MRDCAVSMDGCSQAALLLMFLAKDQMTELSEARKQQLGPIEALRDWFPACSQASLHGPNSTCGLTSFCVASCT